MNQAIEEDGIVSFPCTSDFALAFTFWLAFEHPSECRCSIPVMCFDRFHVAGLYAWQAKFLVAWLNEKAGNKSAIHAYDFSIMKKTHDRHHRN